MTDLLLAKKVFESVLAVLTVIVLWRRSAKVRDQQRRTGLTHELEIYTSCLLLANLYVKVDPAPAWISISHPLCA